MDNEADAKSEVSGAVFGVNGVTGDCERLITSESSSVEVEGARAGLFSIPLARSTTSNEFARSMTSGERREGSAATLRGLVDGAVEVSSNSSTSEAEESSTTVTSSGKS